jgi:hypothetical protein
MQCPTPPPLLVPLLSSNLLKMYETELHNDLAAGCFVQSPKAIPQRTTACLDFVQANYEVNAGHLLVASLGNRPKHCSRDSPIPVLTGAQHATTAKST